METREAISWSLVAVLSLLVVSSFTAVGTGLLGSGWMRSLYGFWAIFTLLGLVLAWLTWMGAAPRRSEP